MLQKPSAEVIGASFIELMPGISQGNFRVGPGESALAVPDVRVRDRVYSPSIRALPSDSAATTTVVMRDVTARRKADTRRLDFYSVIAHDLRTPITSILLRLEMTFRGKHGVLPAGHLSDLRKTETSLRSLMGMINDFLELARLEGVGYKIERKALDLDDLVKHTVEDFRPLLEKNRQRLMQVVANLVGNAIKFTAAGSISTAVLTTSGYVEFSVTDTGRGIEAEEIPGLFERYARSPDVTRETSGTGLGLMIVRELVEAHSGVIGAESSIGKGSKFWFRLPRS
jgi:signal transduction histidine kinase